jgi:hypothetical protein
MLVMDGRERKQGMKMDLYGRPSLVKKHRMKREARVETSRSMSFPSCPMRGSGSGKQTRFLTLLPVSYQVSKYETQYRSASQSVSRRQRKAI